MKVTRLATLLVVLLFMFNSVDAIVINGGKGMLHTKAAWVTETGRLTMLNHSRFWGKVGQFSDKVNNIEYAVTVWDVSGYVNFVYGMGKHFDLSIMPVVYQDVHQGDKEQYPWDTFVSLKIANYGPKASALKYGAQLNARFPTGTKFNVLYEDYTAGRVEWGFDGLLSYAYDPLYPEDSFNMHLNLGYHNHNDAGKNITKNPRDQFSEVLHTSQQFRYALGLTIPTEDFDYGVEWWGSSWFQKPPLAAASREPYLYMGAQVKYKPNRWFNFFVSGDLRLTEDKDETLGPRQRVPGMPNYPTWRVNVGARFVLLPTSVFRTSERDVLMQKAETRRELFEQIIKERRETESAEVELERIKEERRKAEKELERLRKILEGTGERP